MRFFNLVAPAFITGIALFASTASAGNAPLVNVTTHDVDVQFVDVGPNCATGSESRRTVTFSGVSHTLVHPNGSVKFRGNFDGTTSFDDLPVDGTQDATASFRLVVGDTILPTGGQQVKEVFSGTTAATGGPRLRFHVIYQLRLDPDGNPKLEVFRIRCS